MSLGNKKIPVNVAIGVVGNWEHTYQWIPVFAAFATVALAFSAGANNLAGPFSTPIGSGALTFIKALIMACLIYAPGAAFSSMSTVSALLSYFLKEHQPNEGLLMWSMVVVLVTAAIWLAVATHFELPVSSQQSTQSALLGTILVTEGFGYIPMWNKKENHNFSGGGLLWIFLEWTVAPVVSCIFAYLLFNLLKLFLLRREHPEKRMLIFLPVVFGISAGLLCLFVILQIIGKIKSVDKWIVIVAVLAAALIGAALSLFVVVPRAVKRLNSLRSYNSNKQNRSTRHQTVENQDKSSSVKENDSKEKDVEEMLRDFMQTKMLETVYEEEERSWVSPDKIQDPEEVQPVSQSSTATNGQSTPFKELLESTPNRLVQSRNFNRMEETTMLNNASRYIKGLAKSIMHPVLEYDRHILIRHALAEKYDEMEDFFSFPHLVATSIFAIIQSASEIGVIVSLFGAVYGVFKHRAKYSGEAEDVGSIHMSWWFRAIGGVVAAMGYFVRGWRLTQCLGGKLTYISNSRGLASQVSTVAAVIMVSMINLPVSSIHAFVGSLVGVGLADDIKNVNWKLVVKILCGWVLTIICCCGMAYVIFSASIHSPAYVVP